MYGGWNAWHLENLRYDSSMKSRTILIVAVVVIVIGLLILAYRYQRTLELGTPPQEKVTSANMAIAAASIWTQAHGGTVIGILGTGSMVPYIPAAPAGTDPNKTIVAYAATRPNGRLADVTPGTVCVYKHTASVVGATMHGAARLTKYGWVMSGLNNATSDIWMTDLNFIGIVDKTWVWPQ